MQQGNGIVVPKALAGLWGFLQSTIPNWIVTLREGYWQAQDRSKTASGIVRAKHKNDFALNFIKSAKTGHPKFVTSFSTNEFVRGSLVWAADKLPDSRALEFTVNRKGLDDSSKERRWNLALLLQEFLQDRFVLSHSFRGWKANTISPENTIPISIKVAVIDLAMMPSTLPRTLAIKLAAFAPISIALGNPWNLPAERPSEFDVIILLGSPGEDRNGVVCPELYWRLMDFVAEGGLLITLEAGTELIFNAARNSAGVRKMPVLKETGKTDIQARFTGSSIESKYIKTNDFVGTITCSRSFPGYSGISIGRSKWRSAARMIGIDGAQILPETHAILEIDDHRGTLIAFNPGIDSSESIVQLLLRIVSNYRELASPETDR